MVKVASSLTNTISTSGTTAISSTQAYNTAATFTAAAAKANRVQPELSSQVLHCLPSHLYPVKENS